MSKTAVDHPIRLHAHRTAGKSPGMLACVVEEDEGLKSFMHYSSGSQLLVYTCECILTKSNALTATSKSPDLQTKRTPVL